MEQFNCTNQNLEEIPPKANKLTKKIDASKNRIITLESIQAFTQLTFLNVSHNLIYSLLSIKELKNLIVLNVSYNKVRSMAGLENLNNLCALILNNNEIDQISHLNNCNKINTLILSQNQIQTITNIAHLQQLKKLQISHNSIQSLDGITCTSIEEIRANQNRITSIPNSFKDLLKLKILDLGKNNIKDVSSIEVLKNLKLMNLNVSENPCAIKAIDLITQFPRIRLINNLPPEKAKEKALKFQKEAKSKPSILYEEPELEQKIERKKKSGITKMEKFNTKGKKVQKVIAKHLEQSDKIEKW